MLSVHIKLIISFATACFREVHVPFFPFTQPSFFFFFFLSTFITSLKASFLSSPALELPHGEEATRKERDIMGVDAYLHTCGEGSVSICGAAHSYYVLLTQVTLKCCFVRREFVKLPRKKCVCVTESLEVPCDTGQRSKFDLARSSFWRPGRASLQSLPRCPFGCHRVSAMSMETLDVGCFHEAGPFCTQFREKHSTTLASNKKRYNKSHNPKTTNLFKWLQILGKAQLNFSDTSQSGHHQDDRCDNEKSKVLK